MIDAAAASAGAIRTAATNAGNLERQNQERAAQGQPGQSALDVWRHSRDELRHRMDRGRMYENSDAALAAGLTGDWHHTTLDDFAQGMGQQWDTLSDDFLNMVGFGDPTKNPEGVLQNIGAFFGVLTGIEQLLTMAFGMIPFPAFPAIRAFDLALGLPHGHAHPPTFGTPLPSLGPILPIPYVSAANTVLINGMPAGRCGDMGIGVWCGGYVPIFEVFLGSCNVWIEGARAGRVLCDITNHCIFSKRPGPKDPPVGPFIGTMIVASPNVLIGGVPLPSLVAVAMGAAFKALFKGLGKALKAIRKRLGRAGSQLDELAPNRPSHMDECVDGHPVLPVTGDSVDEYIDFELAGPINFVWRRYYYSSWHDRDGPHGWGYRHEYQRELRFNGRAWTYVDPELQATEFLVRDPGYEGVSSEGLLLRRAGEDIFEVFRPGGPTMRFQLGLGQSAAPLQSIRQGKAEILFRYGEHARLDAINACGTIVRLHYDEWGHIARLVSGESTDEAIRASYEYDSSGCLIRSVDALGSYEQYEYDTQCRVTRYVTRLGYSFRYEYDDEGRCIHTWGEDGLYDVRMEYRPERFQTIARYADGATKAYRYNEAGIITEVTDPEGGVTQYILDDEGKVAQEIDPNGNVTDWLYDSSGGQVGRRDPLGYVHPPINVESNPRNPLANKLPETPLEWEFGGFLSVSAAAIPSRDDPVLRKLPPSVVNEIIAAHTRYRTEKPYAASRLRPRRSASRERDVLGRVTEKKGADGSVRRWKYDAAGQVIEYQDRDGSVFRNQYASWRSLRQRVSPLGDVTSFDYNLREYPTKITDPGGTVSEYVYDLKDRIVGVRRHGCTKEQYRYDAADNMIAKLDGRGEVLVSWEVGPGNLDHVRRLASGETHHFEYDEKGRPLSATADGVQLTFAHDETGRRTTDLRGGIGVRNEFDGPHLTATHYLDKFTVTYRWGSDGSLEVTDPTGGKHFFSFSPFGLVVCRLHSGSHELCQYDVNGLCLQKVRFHNSHRFTTWAREYLYSAEGDLVQVNDSQRGTTLYELDDAHRLIREKVPDTVARGIFRDAADNLLVQPGLSSVRMQDGNRLAEANGDRFSYNERNSIAKRSGKAGEIIYGYDSLDMLVRCDVNDQTWRAEYDPLRRRISKTWKDRKTEYYWDDSRLAAEINQDGSARLYLYVHPKALVPFMFVEYASHDDEPESGACYYIATNQIGVPVRVEDQQGREVWDARIDPFGQAHVDPRSSISMPLRFPGHYCDDEINLHCNGFRYYSPELARYLQSDPLGIAGGVNLYAYCVNPLTKVDIDGLADHPKGRQNADPKGESARIDHDADPRAPMRDLADAARDNAPNADARPNTVARLENADGSVRTGQSGTGSAPHSAVQEALDDVPPNQRSPHHGECAEIDAMSQNAGAAEQAGLDPTRANEGALIQTAEVRGAGGDQARHGAPQTPCSSCQHVMNRLGAGYNPR